MLKENTLRLQQKAATVPPNAQLAEATARLASATQRSTAYSTETAEKGTDKELIDAAVAHSRARGQELLLAAQNSSRPPTAAAAPSTNKYTAVFRKTTRPATADSVLQPSARPVSAQQQANSTTPRPPAGLRPRAISSAGAGRPGAGRISSAPAATTTTAATTPWGRGQPLPQIQAATPKPRRPSKEAESATPTPRRPGATTPSAVRNQASQKLGPIRSNTMAS